MEPCLREIETQLSAVSALATTYPLRWMAIKLMEGDSEVQRLIREYHPDADTFLASIEKMRTDFENRYDERPEMHIANRRYQTAGDIARSCIKLPSEGKRPLSDIVDSFVCHRLLVNGPHTFLPSFDIGGAAEWEIGNFDISAVGMNIGESDDGNNYNFFAAQIAYKLKTFLGEGNYRLIIDGTSKEFLDADGKKESRMAAILSFDKELGEIFGGWIRFGWQDDKSLISYDAVFTGGLNITGQWYGREDDNIGIGYAYLNGADDSDLDYSQVFECYWRFVLNDFFAFTADLQYVQDKYENNDDDIAGIIGGIRLTAEFQSQIKLTDS
jgi:hypothetical protein